MVFVLMAMGTSMSVRAVEELETDRNAGLMAVGQAVGEERVVKTR